MEYRPWGQGELEMFQLSQKITTAIDMVGELEKMAVRVRETMAELNLLRDAARASFPIKNSKKGKKQ